MSSLTHERCSELLSDYLTGELDSEERQRVEGHLEHCAQCSAERAGLEVLRSGEPRGLSDQERLALRAAVRDGLESEPVAPVTDESDAVIVPFERRGARAGRYLGIAALLALLAVGSLYVFRGGDDFGGDDAEGEAGVSSLESEDGSEEAGGAEQQAPRAADDDAALEALSKAKSLQLTYRTDRGAISDDDLDRLLEEPAIRNKRSVTASAEALLDDPAADPEELAERVDQAADRSLELLSEEVPESLSEQVSECGASALTELEDPALATYATTATVEGQDAVIIGFLTGEEALNRFALYALDAGDCTTILSSTEGPLN
jgi:anti-sigma factor RsiW